MKFWTGCIALLLVMLTGELTAGRQAGADTDINVGVYQNEPKIYGDPEGPPSGLFAELLRTMAEENGWRLRWHACSWVECLQRLQRGDLDLMPDVAWSGGRERLFDFHQVPVVQSWSQVYIARLVTPPRDFGDLAGLRIAFLRGSIQEREFQQLMDQSQSDWQPLPVASYDEGFAAVRSGRAEAVISNNFFGSRHQQRYGLVETALTFNHVGLYYAASKASDYKAVLRTIDESLRHWKTDPGSPYFKAVERALTEPPRQILPSWFWPLLAGITLLALVVSVTAFALRWQVSRKTRELRQVNQRMSHLLESSPTVIYSRQGEGLPLNWVSGNLENLTGHSVADALRPGWWEDHIHPEDRPRIVRWRHRIGHEDHLVEDYRFYDASGKLRYIRDEMQLLRSDRTASPEVVGSWTDMTERREREEQLSYLTSFDSLTGLGNRRHLQQRLADEVMTQRHAGGRFAILMIDLDRFKMVNENLGATAGDRVIAMSAGRIAELLGSNALLTRYGADEFCAMVALVRDGPAADELALKLVNSLRRPMTVDGNEVVLTASVGLSVFPDDSANAELLARNAEQAMVAAKRQGGDRWSPYSARLSEDAQHQFFLENELRQAVGRGELVLYYQPQLELETGRLVGLEALVRWNHPVRGMVAPGNFIPLAESTGIIFEIDAWVLGEACRQIRAWDDAGLPVPQVAVNVSAAELETDALRHSIEHALEANGLDGTRLEVEVTESMIMRAPENAMELLRELNRLGVAITMDDFGTGYSNLAHVSRLPFDRLKLDQSFVRRIGRSDSTESIIRAIVGMGRTLNLSVVAEGIETDQQARFLREAGCAYGQGYLLGRPAAAEQLNEVLRKGLKAEVAGRRATVGS